MGAANASTIAHSQSSEPTSHKGPVVTALERRAERSFVSERTREEVTERLRAAAERGRLERESQHLARDIIDTTSALKAALASRDVERARSLEDIRRDAQAAWLAAREPAATSPTQPGSDQRPLDPSGDLAAARRDAREQWLALRDRERTLPQSPPSAGQGEKRDASRLIIPDDERAR